LYECDGFIARRTWNIRKVILGTESYFTANCLRSMTAVFRNVLFVFQNGSIDEIRISTEVQKAVENLAGPRNCPNRFRVKAVKMLLLQDGRF
jgi:ribosomal protein L31E